MAPLILARVAPASSSERGVIVPMGCAFRSGSSTFRLVRPPPDVRSRALKERWGALAVALTRAALVGGDGEAPTYIQLPQWPWLNAGTIGRRNNKHASLPLYDLKVKRRHAVFRLEGFSPATSEDGIDANTFWLHPWKGKPCKLLLGRRNHMLHHPRRLVLGDVFCVGHSNIRLVRATRPSPLRDGDDAPYVLMEDTGRRYRRKENKEKRRKRKLNLLASSSSDSDDGDNNDVDEEASKGGASVPSVRLEVVDGPWRGRSLDVSGEQRITIGSSKHCTLALPTDLTVEEVHACLVHNDADGGWYICDCGSTKGTLLLIPDDGAQIDAADVIIVGGTEIAFIPQARDHTSSDDAGDNGNSSATPMLPAPSERIIKGRRPAEYAPIAAADEVEVELGLI